MEALEGLAVTRTSEAAMVLLSWELGGQTTPVNGRTLEINNEQQVENRPELVKGEKRSHREKNAGKIEAA